MTGSEIELCDRLREWAERLGFEVYPEVAGWDLVLVASEPRALGRYGQEIAPGEQVGIHAKLRANCDVLAQAMPGDWADGSAPTWPMVAAPTAGSSFRFVARRLGIGVIEAEPVAPAYRDKGDPRVVEQARRSEQKPLALPPVASRAIVAGAPSPRVLSPWRVKALRFLSFARTATGCRFGASDVKTHGLSVSWVERWGVPVDWTTEVRRGKTARVRVYQLTDNAERLPDWGYRDVYAEMVAADAAAATGARA